MPFKTLCKNQKRGKDIIPQRLVDEKRLTGGVEKSIEEGPSKVTR